jgi:peptidoglycan hydrolase-like protein with peptidoglycan-binding domain
MQPAIDDCIAASIRRICYWTLRSIMEDNDVVVFVCGLGSVRCVRPPVPIPPPQPVQLGGIMPWLDVAFMPSGVESQQLLEAQVLLKHAWQIDPGPLDGKPGTKTINGVKAFQTACGLPPTGIVDGNTWHRLLGSQSLLA